MGSILNQITTLHDHPANSLFDPAKFIVLWDMDQTLLFARLIKTSGNMFRVEWAARPGIFPVLEELNKEGFQQGVFTAAIQPYADNLLDKFDKGCFFGKRRFYRNHTVGGKKDLTAIVGPQLERVVLVDDNALTVVPPEQRKHAILINRWLGEQDDKTGPPEYNLDKVVPAVRALREQWLKSLQVPLPPTPEPRAGVPLPPTPEPRAGVPLLRTPKPNAGVEKGPPPPQPQEEKLRPRLRARLPTGKRRIQPTRTKHPKNYHNGVTYPTASSMWCAIGLP